MACAVSSPGTARAGLTDASLVGSIMAGGVVLPIIAACAAVVAVIARQWRLAGFLACALAVESGAYRATTLVIHRHRPEVHRLETLPVNASYPSGHTAASIAVYCGIALLLTSRIANRAARAAVWTIAATHPGLRRVLASVPRHAPPTRRRSAACSIGVAASECARAAVVARVGEGGPVTKVAVVAHAGKTFGGGLPELRRELERQGVVEPFWVEVPKSRFAPKQVKRLARRRRRAAVRVGRRRDGAAVHRRRWPASEVALADRARRYRQPVRDEPGHPAGHRAGGGDRPARRAAEARRRVASTASTSRSWRAPGSTRR